MDKLYPYTELGVIGNHLDMWKEESFCEREQSNGWANNLGYISKLGNYFNDDDETHTMKGDCFSKLFMCQVMINEKVIETRSSADEETIDYWIFTFKEVYSKYGNKARFLKGVLTEL